MVVLCDYQKPGGGMIDSICMMKPSGIKQLAKEDRTQGGSVSGEGFCSYEKKKSDLIFDESQF